VPNYSEFRKRNHKRESTTSCERAGFVDDIVAASFAMRIGNQIDAAMIFPRADFVSVCRNRRRRHHGESFII
jgi:hypothetical protein